MATNYVNEGKTLLYTNSGSAISSGDVVVAGTTLAVALVDIANGASGTVAIEGVFTLPKVSAAVIAQGEEVIWDASETAFEDNAHTPATGDVSNAAIATVAAGSGTTTVKVKLLPNPAATVA